MTDKIKIFGIITALSITASSAAALVSAETPEYEPELVSEQTLTPEPETVTAENPFADTYGKWYEEPVTYVYTYGLIQGFEDSLFHPDEDVSRAELAAILYRLYCKEQNTAAETPAPEELWYEPAKKWAENNKIMEDFITDNGFDADTALKREEIIYMIYNAYNINHKAEDISDIALDQFTDSSESDAYSINAVKWAVKNKIIMGDDNQRLNPQNNVTRGETSAIIERYLKNCSFENKSETPNPTSSFNTLADAEAAAGYSFPKLNINGFTETGFSVINRYNTSNSVIEVSGHYLGKAVTIRTGKGDRAISGIYGGEVLEDGITGISVDFIKYNNTIYAEWSKEISGTFYSYSVAIENGTADNLSIFVDAIGAVDIPATQKPVPTVSPTPSVKPSAAPSETPATSSEPSKTDEPIITQEPAQTDEPIITQEPAQTDEPEITPEPSSDDAISDN